MSLATTIASADKGLWASTTKSMRVDGAVTSIRLENIFWGILADIAKRDELPLPQMITLLYNESINAGYNMSNFTSFLRVCCVFYIESVRTE